METKITSENIEEINRRLKYIHDKFDVDVDIDNCKPIQIGDTEICIPFYAAFIYYEISEFLEYTTNIESLKKINQSTVCLNHISQTKIIGDFGIRELILKGLYVETDKYTMTLIESPFFIELLTEKSFKYYEEEAIAVSQTFAVEIKYNDISNKLTLEQENNLIMQFLYSICIDYDIYLEIGEFIDEPEQSPYYDYDFVEKEDNLEIAKTINYNNKLIPYSSAMDMYMTAFRVDDSEIKFLYFYKIIEYFSPIVAKKKSYELLNQKLDVLSISNRDYKYLDSIFDLTRKYDLSLRDKELAFTVISNCIDIVEIYEYLPDNIRNNIFKEIRFKDITSLESDKYEQVIKKIANVIYSTRNYFVHAKSNYNQTGNECKTEDLDQLNVFMSKLCYCLIVWNGRQSEGFRV